MQYEKRKLKGEAVYIDTLTYDEFMLLDDAGADKRFMEMDRKEAEQEYREQENTGELAYTPDEETEKNLVAELIALKKTNAKRKVEQSEEESNVKDGSKKKPDTGSDSQDKDMPVNGNGDDTNSSADNDTGNNSGDTLAHRLEHMKFSPAQKSEIKRAVDEKLPEEYILSYANPENSVVKMATMRKKYGEQKAK